MKNARLLAAVIGAGALALSGAIASADSGPSDAEIAHIAYTAGAIDAAAGKQALAKNNPSHESIVLQLTYMVMMPRLGRSRAGDGQWTRRSRTMGTAPTG